MKIVMSKKVKYQGEYISPNTPFEIKETELEQFRTLGAHVVEAVSKQEEEIQNDEVLQDVQPEETEIDKVKAHAESLGIKVGNKGIKRLLDEIQALEG